jgi:N-formylglutamate deformylase
LKITPPPWKIINGDGPLLATAIHNGHFMPSEGLSNLALDSIDRLREEDPYTGEWTQIAPARVIGNLSRFWIDLNRPKEAAAYVCPEDAWGLEVWNQHPQADEITQRLESHSAFYQEMFSLLSNKKWNYGYFVILDIHSYNHRRGGVDAAFDNPELNPEINIGTGTLLNRKIWDEMIEQFIEGLRGFDFKGRSLDVRENVKFYGGYFPEWVHSNFPDSGCVISIEVKKFFMDEWTGEINSTLFNLVQEALSSAVPGVITTLQKLEHEFSMANSPRYFGPMGASDG